MLRRRQSLPRPARGFTLLELLLATAVSAIVLLAINATFFGALRLHNTTHEKIDRDLVLQRALGIVRRDLAGLMLPTGGNGVTLAGQLQSSDFSSSATDPVGERVSPDFYTNSGKVDGWSSFSEVQRVSYFLAPATDGSNTKNLLRAITRNLLPVQETAPDEQMLLAGVSSASVEFFDGIDWIEDWDSTVTSTLPTAIKFRLVMARPLSGGSGTIPEGGGPVELVVPVLVMTTTAAQAATEGGATP